MASITNRRRRIAGGIAVLALALGVALTLPVPALPDADRALVHERVSERLPGWEVERLRPSWEGAYTVVVACAGRQIGFNYVPGHGLPPDSAWVQPNDAYARDRLGELSDHRRYLVWFHDRDEYETISCQDELARSGDGPVIDRHLD